jgi:hypothetical protein
MRSDLEHPADLEHCGCCGSENIDTDPVTAGIARCRDCHAEASWWAPSENLSNWTTQEEAQLGRERLTDMIADADAHEWNRGSEDY